MKEQLTIKRYTSDEELDKFLGRMKQQVEIGNASLIGALYAAYHSGMAAAQPIPEVKK